jgi:hypothetical protein
MTTDHSTHGPLGDPLEFAVVTAISLGASALCSYVISELLRRKDEEKERDR